MKFNPDNKQELTYEESLSPAMKIIEQDDADEYFKGYVEFIQKALDKKPRSDKKTAEEIAKTNLGYYAGYYDQKTRERIERLFNCVHPIFGKIKNGEPTVEEAYDLAKENKQ